MSLMSLTTIAIYDYLKLQGRDLFAGLNLPDGIDKDVVINNILLQGGSFETLYPDADFLAQAITIWANASHAKWERMQNAWVQAAEFNPLENYDRTEDGTDATTVKANIISENKVSAYDSPDYSESGKQITTQDPNENETQTKHDLHIHGNIGVTSLAQLLAGYDEAVINWDLVAVITHDFIKTFCIMVY